MNLAFMLATRSHCVRLKVGAVITKDNRIISIGYNGPPAKTYNCDEEWPETGCPPSLRGGCSLAVHAEENAISYAILNNASLTGATLYVTLSPCLSCARLIFTMGIKRVVYYASYMEYKNYPYDEGIKFLTEFGIKVERYTPNPLIMNFSDYLEAIMNPRNCIIKNKQ